LAKYDKAVECYRSALAVSREIAHAEKEGECLNALGEVYHHLGQHHLSAEYYALAEQVRGRADGTRRG
jgi:tetratricopeptide (TPR) repeat protein